MNILETICGRAGSKGVKNKNFREFLGKPLVDCTVEVAKKFKENNKDFNVDICLNSDSKELLEIGSRNGGVEKIERPIELAQDTSLKVTVIKDSLEYMEKMTSKSYNYVIDLNITSPLRTINDIENALHKAIGNEKIDVVLSVVPSRRNPYFNMAEIVDGKVRKVKEENFVRRQDTREVYDMNASIYCYRRKSLLNKLQVSPLEGINEIITMKDTAVLDIDSEEDFELMEVLGKHFFENEFRELYGKVNEI